jgi:hypothetical protein
LRSAAAATATRLPVATEPVKLTHSLRPRLVAPILLPASPAHAEPVPRRRRRHLQGIDAPEGRQLRQRNGLEWRRRDDATARRCWRPADGVPKG